MLSNVIAAAGGFLCFVMAAICAAHHDAQATWSLLIIGLTILAITSIRILFLR